MILGKVIWFLVLHITVYFLLVYAEENQVIKKSVVTLYKKTKENEKSRSDSINRLRLEEGNQDKFHFLYKLDLLLLQSNIKVIFPFLNSEIYLISILCMSSLGFIVIETITNSLITGTIGSLFIILLFYSIPYLFSGINYKKTENEIMSFINLLENYSKTSDDLISIFGKLYHYLEEPLKTAVEECYLEGRSTGDLSYALYNLSNRIEHSKFKEIIRNIEICARHEANYAEIVKDSRGLLRDYIASQKEKKALISNGRIEILIILSCCVVMIWMLDNFMEQSMIQLLLHTFVGNIIALYCIIVTCITVITMIRFDK